MAALSDWPAIQSAFRAIIEDLGPEPSNTAAVFLGFDADRGEPDQLQILVVYAGRTVTAGVPAEEFDALSVDEIATRYLARVAGHVLAPQPVVEEPA